MFAFLLITKKCKHLINSFSALTLLVWRQEGHPAGAKLGVGLLTVSLELCTTYTSSVTTTSIILSFNKTG